MTVHLNRISLERTVQGYTRGDLPTFFCVCVTVCVCVIVCVCVTVCVCVIVAGLLLFGYMCAGLGRILFSNCNELQLN